MNELKKLNWEDFEKELDKYSLENKEIIETEYTNKIILLKLIEFFKCQIKNYSDEIQNLELALKQNDIEKIKELNESTIEYNDSPYLREFLKYKEFGKNYWITE